MQRSEPSSKPGILSQNRRFKERKLRLRWLLAFSSLPLFGIFTAFGIAPQTSVQDINIHTVVENIELPETIAPLVQVDAQNSSFWQADQIRRDDTLASLLSRLNITNDDAIEFLKRNPDARALATQLRPGRSIQAQTNQDGQLLKLQYQTDNNSTLHVELTANGYEAHVAETVMETHSVLKSAEIKSSLFGATDEAGIPDAIAIQLAEIFSSDIDFHSDLRRGDRFVVVYEASYWNGELARTGQVLAAEFINNGKTYRAVRYRTPEGQVSYYTPEGKSLHKSFLRSPLEFSRISSGFSLGRFHPILQKMRAHKGVDYAAPIGTRVKASADAVVDFVGVKNGYGNVVVLRHQNGISTVYGHLSRFATGLHRGSKVSQGDIIAYVGMTGLATGPHLHYEFLLNGQHRDPLTVALPNAVPIAPKYKADFIANSSKLVAQLQLLIRSNLASLE
ncbi:OapA family protein [Methylovorus mays]|uniref:OapA family protein n=1 Tax=Methylovorus mays TaxID=184077 RepID=UPI001E2836AA|nr:peptidoglycan DD-metalloendopeptidase family protein [Methylovorus mays]MCB5208380.1 peptidoglycan DD-metalloendopeptidase family protein [Methylovorus mays]